MGLDCTLTAEQTGGELRFVLAAENVGDEPVELTFRSGQTVEVVTERDGEDVWRYGAGRMFTQALETVTIAPGETVSESVTWDDPEPGSYDVRAWLCAEAVDCEATATVTY